MSTQPSEPNHSEAVEIPPLAEIAPAAAAFERGDFQATRAQLRKLLATEPPEPVALAARKLLDRMAPDPWAMRIGIGAAGLLALVVLLYVL